MSHPVATVLCLTTAQLVEWDHWTNFQICSRSRILMIRTGMREVIELISEHPKIRRILRCESPYFHHWSVGKGSDHLQLIKFWPSRAPGKGVRGGAKIFGSALLQSARIRWSEQ